MSNEGDEAMTNPEVEDSFGPPAVFVNRFQVQMLPATTRISFAERAHPDAKPKYRLAVVMHTTDAVELAALLSELLQDLAAKVKAEMKP